MPHCIAPGCTSGYLSNYEKKHFFYVPKDDKSIKLWQTALRRKNFIVKAYQPVCENHFLPEDIIWRRTITDKDGNILGESAPYKIPRLRKGAVPSQFPWTEETTITKEVTMTENEADQPDIARVDIFPNVASETHISFTDLIEAVDKSKINMPEQWTYVKHFDNNIKLLIFFLPTCSTLEECTDRYTIYTKKEVIVNEQMKLNINIMKQVLTDIPANVKIHQHIETLEQLTESLFSVDSFNMCSGVVNINKQLIEFGHSAAFQDMFGIWRHKKCLLVISETLKICKFCTNVLSSLKRKANRAKLVKKYERIKFTMSTHSTNTQQKLVLLQKKYYKAEKARKRFKILQDLIKKYKSIFLHEYFLYLPFLNIILYY